jgi:hypothetical protein
MLYSLPLGVNENGDVNLGKIGYKTDGCRFI